MMMPSRATGNTSRARGSRRSERKMTIAASSGMPSRYRNSRTETGFMPVPYSGTAKMGFVP